MCVVRGSVISAMGEGYFIYGEWVCGFSCDEEDCNVASSLFADIVAALVAGDCVLV